MKVTLLPILLVTLIACTPDADEGPSRAEAERLEAFCGADWRDVEARVDGLLQEMTLEQKIRLMAGSSVLPSRGLWRTPGIPDLEIPGFQMVDGPRGVHKATGAATAFPVGMARGATWDPALERRVGERIAREARARGASVLLAPTINVLRHPRWGRAQETYGEDPVHIGALAVAFVRGVQSQKVVASAKHFAVNSIEDTRFEVDVQIGERALREVYLPHFRRVVEDAHVGSVMSAYNSVNGAFASENARLLRDILKGEWGFVGFVESDWVFGTQNTVPALEAGLDIEMPFPQIYGQELAAAVEAGEADAALIDAAVRRILRVQLCFDLDVAPPLEDPSALETPEALGLAREVAQRSIVLLKNEGELLPLDPGARIALTGPLADVENIGDEGSSDVEPSDVVTVLEGLEAALPAASLVHTDDPAELASADVIVLVAGLTSETEGEGFVASGDRASMGLPEAQVEAILGASASGVPVVVVLEGGSAITMEDWLGSVEGLLMAWYPGSQGGHAIADVLLGEVAPSGRLPISFPVREEDLPAFDNVSLEVEYDAYHGYRHLQREGVAPRFPFGFGLSTTTFEYDAARVERVEGGLEVEVDVTNTGSRAAIETVQVYVSLPGSSFERADRELEGFAQLELAPGGAGTASIRIEEDALRVYDEGSSAWTLEAGLYRIEVGSSAASLPLSLEVALP